MVFLFSGTLFRLLVRFVSAGINKDEFLIIFKILIQNKINVE